MFLGPALALVNQLEPLETVKHNIQNYWIFLND